MSEPDTEDRARLQNQHDVDPIYVDSVTGDLAIDLSIDPRYVDPETRALVLELMKLYESRTRREQLRTMSYSDYLQTPEWKQKRREAIDRACRACQLCNATSNLHVHHRTYERRGAEQASDLTVLCAHCHRRFHDKPPDPLLEKV